MGDATSPKAGEGPSRQKAAAKKSTNPKMYDMLVEAISNLNDRKGASVPGIKNYITETYTSVDPNMLKYRLRRALEKAIENGVVVRPKASENSAVSLSGRYKVDKAKLAALNKPKEKKTTKVVASGEPKPKKKATVAKKSPRKQSKSPKKTLTKGAKSPTKKAKKTGEKTKKATDKTKKKPKAKTLTKAKPAKKTAKPKAK